MFAYVFWHRPAAGVDTGAYESAVSDFLAALADDAPPGLVDAAVAVLDRPPFTWPGRMRGAGPTYEDWYLLEDGAALDDIEAVAVGPRCRATHGVVASMAASGTAGLYRLAHGSSRPHMASTITWLDPPAGAARGQWTARLAEESAGPDDRGMWVRRLTLGPAPEFCLIGSQPPLPGSLVVNRRPVAGPVKAS